jgi:hypothetical protein
VIEGDAADEAQMRDAVAVSNGQRLCDAATDAMTYDAGPTYSELVEERYDSRGVSPDVDGTGQRAVASSIAEEIDDDQPVSGWHQRYHVVPQVARSGEAVQEHDRLAGAACSGRVIVESRPTEIEELTAHADSR